jgi:hypothetical protein
MGRPMDYRDTPIFLNNRNRLSIGFKDLLLWLRRAGHTSIAVIDNDSTYPLLLDFYDSPAMEGIQLIHAGANLGPEAFWRLDLHLLPACSPRYIYTDSDIVPDKDCPLDLVRKMHEVADRYAPAKVGPSIRIDNIPDCFAQKDHMRFCESDYWARKYSEGDCWNAALDTTMSIYESAWGSARWPLAEQGGVQHVRLDFPYVVEHRPWYSDSANLSAEEKYYRAHVKSGFSSSCLEPVPLEPA